MPFPKINTDGPAKIAQALQDHLGPDDVAKAISSGLNKAATGIRAELSKRMGNDINLKASVMKGIIPIEKSTPDTLESTIRVKGTSIPLYDFTINLSQLQQMEHEPDTGFRKPVKIKILKSGPVKELTSGFLAPTYHNIMQREGEARGPLDMMFGPNLTVFAQDIQSDMHSFTKEIVEKRISEALSYQIKKAFL